MDRTRYFIVIALGVLLGASLEYMKDVNPHSAKLARLARLEALMDGGKVVYQPFSKRASFKSKTIHGDIAALDAPKAEDKSQKTIAPAKKDDDKKKKDEKKKKDDKKKKKTKTIKGKGDPKADSDNKKDGAKNDSGFGDDPISYGGGERPQADKDKQPETAEEWLAFLMPSPDFEKMAKFVKLYQAGGVKADVYYEVIAAVLEDDRPKMRELGVMALGSTPSVKSFTALVDFTSTEANGSPAKSQAQVYIRMYERLEYLQHLVGAITSGDVNAALEALHQLNIAVATKLKRTGTDPGTQDTTPRTPASNISRYFDPVADALQSIVQNGTAPNPSVRDEVNRTLQNLNSSLGHG